MLDDIKKYLIGFVACALILTPIGAGILRSHIADTRELVAGIVSDFEGFRESVEQTRLDVERAQDRGESLGDPVAAVEGGLRDLEGQLLDAEDRVRDVADGTDRAGEQHSELGEKGRRLIELVEELGRRLTEATE
jgi:hypothetical protein